MDLNLKKEQIPRHVAVIMDGNGRWAKKRGLPRVAGHRIGAESLREVLKASAEFGIEYLTVYAFSTENWRRPKEEVEFLMGLLSETIDKEIASLISNGVRLRFLGRINDLPQKLQEKIAEAHAKTAHCSKVNLQVMLSYGGRAEIVDAANRLIDAVRSGKLSTPITEEQLSYELYTAGIPDPDLMIRTASEIRVSNFLLWQVAYAEFYFTSTLWPDFRRDSLIEALNEYAKRVRRYGAVK